MVALLGCSTAANHDANADRLAAGVDLYAVANSDGSSFELVFDGIGTDGTQVHEWARSEREATEITQELTAKGYHLGRLVILDDQGRVLNQELLDGLAGRASVARPSGALAQVAQAMVAAAPHLRGFDAAHVTHVEGRTPTARRTFNDVLGYALERGKAMTTAATAHVFSLHERVFSSLDKISIPSGKVLGIGAGIGATALLGLLVALQVAGTGYLGGGGNRRDGNEGCPDGKTARYEVAEDANNAWEYTYPEGSPMDPEALSTRPSYITGEPLDAASMASKVVTKASGESGGYWVAKTFWDGLTNVANNEVVSVNFFSMPKQWFHGLSIYEIDPNVVEFIENLTENKNNRTFKVEEVFQGENNTVIRRQRTYKVKKTCI